MVEREEPIELPQGAKCEKIYPPPITGISRLVRRETVSIIFECDRFFVDITALRSCELSYGWHGANEWTSFILFVLPFLNQITIKLSRRKADFQWKHEENPSVALRHNSQRNCWSITSSDDWSGIKDEAKRAPLERDSNIILPRMLARMLGQRSRSDLSAGYLMWLIADLELYTVAKIGGADPPTPECGWYKFTVGKPRIGRPTGYVYAVFTLW